MTAHITPPVADERLEPARFFLNTPLYEVIECKDVRHPNYLRLRGMGKRNRFDGYEVINGVETTFTWDIYTSLSLEFDSNHYAIHELTCTRFGTKYFFWIRFSGDTITKVGQYPSLADLHTSQVKDYKGVLSKEQRGELVKAIGLAAHGVGIGSFVYLRRIFEGLIWSAFEGKKEQMGVEDFRRLRMDEKIEALKDVLPDFLVEHRSIYGILSKGIHELSEADCLASFSALHAGIEAILDEKVEQHAKAERRRVASEKLKAATAALQNGK